MSNTAQDVEVSEFRTLKGRFSWPWPSVLDGYCFLRPNCAKIRGCSSGVVEAVHFKKHFLPLPKKATTPERIVAVDING